MNGEYYTLPKRATVPDEVIDSTLRRVAMYEDASKQLCFIPMTDTITPQSGIHWRRRDWRLVRVLDVLPGETVEQALERAIAEEIGITEKLVEEILADPTFDDVHPRPATSLSGSSVR